MPTSPRSEASRRDLVEATARLLCERGVQGLRIRDVAASAGMSPGAVLYHYENTKELLFVVHQKAVGDYTEARHRANSEGDPEPRARLIRCFKAGVPTFAGGATIELLYEVHGLARRSHRHAELLSELWASELAMYVEVIGDGVAWGVFEVEDAEVAARALLALEDGLVLHLVSSNERLDSSLVVETFQRAAARILGCPSLANSRPRAWRSPPTTRTPRSGS